MKVFWVDLFSVREHQLMGIAFFKLSGSSLLSKPVYFTFINRIDFSPPTFTGMKKYADSFFGWGNLCSSH